MIARLFYLVILKMGYLLFFSGGNEIRHFIALLRSYRGTLYTIDVVESAAALSSEIYRRCLISLQLIFENDQPISLYVIDDLWDQIKDLPRTYTIALDYFLKKMAEYFNSDEALCNTFFAVCDLALQIPPPHIVNEGLNNGGAVSNYLPGDRFVNIVNYLADNYKLIKSVPEADNAVLREFLEVDYADIMNKTKDFERHNPYIEQWYFRQPTEEEKVFEAGIDEICDALGYDRVRQITHDWIDLLIEHRQIAYKDELVKLRLSYFCLRRAFPAILSSYCNIERIINSGKYPSFCVTPENTWVTARDPDKYPGFVEAVWSTIHLRMFVRNIGQLIGNMPNICPFSGKVMYDCPKETTDCSTNMKPRKNGRASECLFEKYFRLIFKINYNKVEISD